jgi:hypothetical protein
MPDNPTCGECEPTLILLLFAAGSAMRSYAGTDDYLVGGSANVTGPTVIAVASQAPATNVPAAAEKFPAAMKLVGKPVTKAFKLPQIHGPCRSEKPHNMP